MATSGLTVEQQRQLKKLASAILERLATTPKGIGLRLNSRASQELASSWSGGDWTRLGTMRNLGSLELWLDQYTGWGYPQFWYGLGLRDATRAELAAKLGQAVLGEAAVRQVLDEDTHRPDDEYDRMKRPLPTREFGRPLLHLHGFNNCGYGVYEKAEAPYSSAAFDRLVDRAARFFRGIVLEAAGLAFDAPSADLAAHAELNARSKPPVQGAWKRHARLMKTRKQRDGFTCQVCQINFSTLYGPLGAGYAEVHHIVSLASRKQSHTSLETLLTVCANCHAMLTRAPEGPEGVDLVKSSFTGRWPQVTRAVKAGGTSAA